MDHVVPHLQLIEVLDLLALVEPLGALLLFLRAEDVRLGEHHEFQQRILESFVYMAVIGHHLPGLDLPQGIFCVDGGEFLIPQVLRQALCPGAGAGQQQDTVTVSAEHLQIPHQSLEAVVVGSHVPGGHVHLPVGLEIPLCLHGGQGDHAAL